MHTTVKLHSLEYNNAKTYIAAALFAVGNIVLPQLCHLVPQGGVTWLPIYFFTLVAAYKYGWLTGVLTATVSPLANSALFGMPAAAVLPAIMLKSILLAIVAAIVATRYRKVSLSLLALVVLLYQAFGTLGEWLLCGDIAVAMQDLRVGIPGMLLQIFGGYAVIRLLK